MLTTQLTGSETSLDKKNPALSDIKHCENCKAPLSGPFCANCGQEADSTLKYFWRVILHLLDDIFSFDSRASRTLVPLIARPAFLTNEYFAGRRVHYVPPLRLYLFISIVFFITLKFFVVSNSTFNHDNDNKAVIEQVKGHIEDLEKQQRELKKVVNPVSVEEAALTEKATADTEIKMHQLTEDIAKFNSYLTDLTRDDKEGSNKQIIKITKELVELEFDKATAGLSDEEQQEVAKLLSRRDDYLNGKDIGESGSQFTIGNREDGPLRFDFLSEQSNKKLEKFSKDFSVKAEKAFNSDKGPVLEQVIGKLPQLMFILLPLFAVLLKVMFIFSKRLYMEHLTVALHSHSFIFIILLMSTMLDGLYDCLNPTNPDIADFIKTAALALLAWVPIYLFIMQKRVYKQGYFITLVKYSIIGVMYNIMILVAGLIAMIWGIMET